MKRVIVFSVEVPDNVSLATIRRLTNLMARVPNLLDIGVHAVLNLPDNDNLYERIKSL